MMKLSIVPVDGAVIIDGVGHTRLSWEDTPSNIHALQWENHKGIIEYTDGQHNEEITSLPLWALNAASAWNAAANPPPEPVLPPTAEHNSLVAKGEMFQTDWSENPSVRDPARSPYLINGAEFDDYREQLRRMAINPVAGDIVWPVRPTPIWG